MKKFLFITLAAIAVSMCSLIYAGSPINVSELPADAQSFLTKYFPGDPVKKVEKDTDRRGVEYDVDLTSGAEVEFMSDGKWKEVKAAKGNSVPSDIIPEAIANHVNTNYSGLTIVEISRKRGGYEVELSNGTELKLTEDAQPLPERKGNGTRKGGKGGRRSN